MATGCVYFLAVDKKKLRFIPFQAMSLLNVAKLFAESGKGRD
jgi:hypothetical protein